MAPVVDLTNFLLSAKQQWLLAGLTNFLGYEVATQSWLGRSNVGDDLTEFFLEIVAISRSALIQAY